ncbi:MAG TPA: hypothetical protein VFP33_12820 [Gallionella sp.]|nr:hypothetical protein [Gallionella sp.]
MPNNIDDFNSGVAHILGKLYENFPKEIDLNFNDFAIKDSYQDGAIQRENIERHNDLYEIYFNTGRFLLAEGYIRGKKVEGKTTIAECALTTKGLVALQRVPDSIQGKQRSVGDFLLDLGKDGLKTATKEALSAAVRAIFNG